MIITDISWGLAYTVDAGTAYSPTLSLTLYLHLHHHRVQWRWSGHGRDVRIPLIDDTILPVATRLPSGQVAESYTLRTASITTTCRLKRLSERTHVTVTSSWCVFSDWVDNLLQLYLSASQLPLTISHECEVGGTRIRSAARWMPANDKRRCVENWQKQAQASVNIVFDARHVDWPTRTQCVVDESQSTTTRFITTRTEYTRRYATAAADAAHKVQRRHIRPCVTVKFTRYFH